VIAYRGTPVPEAIPESRDFACVFFSRDFKSAAQYGAYVQAYDLGRQRLLNFDSEEAARLVFFHTGVDKREIRSDDWEDTAVPLFMFPEDDWREVVKAKGYTGTSFGRDLCIFDPSSVLLIDLFKVAMKAFPACIAGGLDRPKTVSDLVYQALHELDMYEEGQDGAITSRCAKVVREFIRKFRTPEMK